MKVAALVFVLFALLTAAYGLAVVVPKYVDANRAYTSAPAGGYGVHDPARADKRHRIETTRDELRGRSQSYAMAIVATSFVGLVLAVIGRKKSGPKTGLVVGLAVLGFVSVVVMQGMGNIF